MRKHYEPIVTKQTLNRVREERMPFEWSINPYRGCTHGCSFCYARAFQTFIGLGAEDEFQNHILLKRNAAEALRAQLERMAKRVGRSRVGREIGLVAIGTATDPYQPVEGKEQLTRACLEVLAEYRVPVTITTRSPLVLRDIDLLRRLPVASVNVSIHTLDVELTRRLEPATPFPLKRLETVRTLNEAGVRAGIFAAPLLPFLSDSRDSLEALFAVAAEHGASFAMTSLLRLSPSVKTWFYQTLRVYYPKLLPAYARLYDGAYAERTYRESVMRVADELREKYGLTRELPTKPEADSQSCPATALFRNSSPPIPGMEAEVEVEQLAFDL